MIKHFEAVIVKTTVHLQVGARQVDAKMNHGTEITLPLILSNPSAPLRGMQRPSEGPEGLSDRALSSPWP